MIPTRDLIPMDATLTTSLRSSTYYWKCDRPAAFHGTSARTDVSSLQTQLKQVVQERHPKALVQVQAGSGQGNHITFLVAINGDSLFARLEDGPEKDNYLEVESRVLREVRALGLPAPQVHAVDASRTKVPFAWQLMDRVESPDLNQLLKQERLNLPVMAREIGAAVAHWQCFQPPGFGPFDPEILRQQDRLVGFHACYEDYFFLHLERHLHYLTQNSLLTRAEASEIESEILQSRALLALEQGCLVHKDLALWNILGTETGIAAFIDWDDAISGDPMDDLSLLGCFYDGPVLEQALGGYQMLRPLPSEHRRRFWLHLLRNMLVKAVIRLGAGYFRRTDGFFLIGSGTSGADLQAFTTARLAAALKGLRNESPIESLGH